MREVVTVRSLWYGCTFQNPPHLYTWALKIYILIVTHPPTDKPKAIEMLIPELGVEVGVTKGGFRYGCAAQHFKTHPIHIPRL